MSRRRHSLWLVSLSVTLLQLRQVAAAPSVLSKRAVSVQLDGKTFVNKGLVGFGFIPSDAKESTGDTIGGIGSAIALKPGSWKATGDGTFKGAFIVHPDRGFNVDGTVDYQARQHEISFSFKPYYGSAALSFEEAQKTLNLTYVSTVLQVDSDGVRTTGLDALSFRDSTPELPIPNEDDDNVSLDVEGIVANADGTFWISDEYGPYIYHFSADGTMLSAIQPPKAIVPLDKNGEFSFSSDDDPKTGRAGNKGFESLTLDRRTSTLYAMLQAATIQDGGDDKSTSRHTRMVAYDVSYPSSPKLVGEYVVPLPQTSKGNTLECNELVFIGDGIFLALSRDGDGRSGDDLESKYKQADLISIVSATNIANTKFDIPSNPVAKKGKLDSTVTPATYVSFVNFLTDLGKFGLHNDEPDDRTLIAAKWEGLTLAPVGETGFPNDFFLFAAADNDFISTHGVSLGVPFDAGLDVDNQFLVFRVTLPGLTGAALGV